MFLSKLFQIFRKEVIPSKVNGTVYIGKSFGKKAIFANNIPQSGGEYEYMWSKVISGVDKNFKPENCLMLGVAGGTAINVLRKYYPTLSILGVELDSVILKTALENNFFREESHLKLEIDDAIKWVKQDDKKYDLIVVDLYIGDLNPQESREKPFIENIKKLLKPGGVVLYNCHYQKINEADYQNFRKVVDKVFTKTEEVFVFPKNKILLFTF